MVECAVNDCIKIEICLSRTARQYQCVTLTVAAGTSILAAIAQSAFAAEFAQSADALPLSYSIWGERIRNHTSYVLNDGDRLEVLRPLRVDPMAARRERFAKQGAKTAGLFAQRRPGAKPGY